MPLNAEKSFVNAVTGHQPIISPYCNGHITYTWSRRHRVTATNEMCPHVAVLDTHTEDRVRELKAWHHVVQLQIVYKYLYHGHRSCLVI